MEWGEKLGFEGLNHMYDGHDDNLKFLQRLRSKESMRGMGFAGGLERLSEVLEACMSLKGDSSRTDAAGCRGKLLWFH